jgi:hypothetical protein
VNWLVGAPLVPYRFVAIRRVLCHSFADDSYGSAVHRQKSVSTGFGALCGMLSMAHRLLLRATSTPACLLVAPIVFLFFLSRISLKTPSKKRNEKLEKKINRRRRNKKNNQKSKKINLEINAGAQPTPMIGWP